jgi:hypothetical protein
MAAVHQYDRMMSATYRMGEKNRRCKLQRPSKICIAAAASDKLRPDYPRLGDFYHMDEENEPLEAHYDVAELRNKAKCIRNF